MSAVIAILSTVLLPAVATLNATGKERTDSSAAPRTKTNLTKTNIEEKLVRMRELCKGRSRVELIKQFKDEDIAAWPPAFAGQAVQALNLRGTGFCHLNDYKRAEKDFTLALKFSPSNAYLWNSLGNVYQNQKDNQKALDAYNKAFELDSAQHTAKSYGWMPISATLNAVSILIRQTKYQKALKIMERYDDSDIQKMAPVWGSKILRAYGQIYAALGREKESLAKFKEALELEKK